MGKLLKNVWCLSVVSLMVAGTFRCTTPRACASDGDCSEGGECREGRCFQPGLFRPRTRPDGGNVLLDGGRGAPDAGADFAVEILGQPSYGVKTDNFIPAEMTWKRDETVAMRVTSTTARLFPGEVALEVGMRGATASIVVQDSTPCVGLEKCLEFRVRLSAVPMPMFSGELKVSLRGKNGETQPTSRVTGVTNVTRWNWATRVGPGLGNFEQMALVVDSEGVWYLPRSDYLRSGAGAGTEGIVPIDRNGSILRELKLALAGSEEPANPVLTQVSGVERVVFLSRVATGYEVRLGRYSDETSIPCELEGDMGQFSQLVLSASDSMIAISASRNSQYPIQVDLQRFSCGLRGRSGPPISQGLFRGQLATDGARLYFPVLEGLSSVELAGQSAATFKAEGNYYRAVSMRRGDVVVSNISRDAGLEVSAYGNLGPTWTSTSLKSLYTGNTALLVTSSQDVIATTTDGKDYASVRVSKDGTKSFRVKLSNFPGFAPVLGADKKIYFVELNGSVIEILSQDFQDNQVPEKWDVPPQVHQLALPPDAGFSILGASAPTITCNRNHPESKTGILGFATANGWFVTYIVDSPGLDADAAWPRALHDNRNSSNVTTPIERCP